MKTARLIFAFTTTAVLCGLAARNATFSQVQPSAPLQPPAQAQANTPAFPVLENWLAFRARGGKLESARRIGVLSRRGIAGIDWKPGSKEAVVDMSARYYQAKTHGLFSIGVSRGPEPIVRRYYRWDGHSFATCRWPEEQQGWLHLISSTGPALATRTVSTGDPQAKERTFQRSLVALKVVRTNLVATPIEPGEIKPAFVPQYFLDYDPARDALTIRRRETGQFVAVVPPSALPGRPGFKNQRRLEVRHVDLGLMVAGLEVGNRTPLQLIWHIRQGKTKTWWSTRRIIDDAYLRSLLPRELGKVKFDPEQNQRVALWKDGSIVFRLQGELAQEGATVTGTAANGDVEGGDSMTGVFLIMQPPRGRPRLLSWALYHQHGPGVLEQSAAQRSVAEQGAAEQGAAKQSAATENAGDGYGTMWFPAEYGNVKAEIVRTDWRNDFHFDVDVANDTVFYLLGGKLWSIDVV